MLSYVGITRNYRYCDLNSKLSVTPVGLGRNLEPFVGDVSGSGNPPERIFGTVTIRLRKTPLIEANKI